MQKFSRLATAAAAITFMSLPATVVLAQNAPTKGTVTTTAPPTAPADARPATATEQAARPRKKKVGKMSRQQEIDKSNCPFPAHYSQSVHKEYEHCVPFDKLW